MPKLPDEWRFLEEGPEDWDAPPELRKPPKSSTMNLIMQIVASDFGGNDVLEAAGRVLSSYAALNAWLCRKGDRELGFERVTRIATEISFITRDIYLAWTAYRTVFEPSRRAGVGEDERLKLLRELNDGAIRLDRLRRSGHNS